MKKLPEDINKVINCVCNSKTKNNKIYELLTINNKQK